MIKRNKYEQPTNQSKMKYRKL